MGVVAGEERVMTQSAKASAARGQPAALFGGELQRVPFAAAPLSRRHLGCVWERHLKQQEQTPKIGSSYDNKTTTGSLNIRTF